MTMPADAKALMRIAHGQVFTRGSDIVVVKKGVGNPITIILESAGRDQYVIRFPTYLFESKISHFSPTEEEKRFCRNKNVLISTIKELKKVNIWEKIKNKDFLKVNDQNRKAPKKELKEVLDGLLSNLPSKDKIQKAFPIQDSASENKKPKKKRGPGRPKKALAPA